MTLSPLHLGTGHWPVFTIFMFCDSDSNMKLLTVQLLSDTTSSMQNILGYHKAITFHSTN